MKRDIICNFESARFTYTVCCRQERVRTHSVLPCGEAVRLVRRGQLQRRCSTILVARHLEQSPTYCHDAAAPAHRHKGTHTCTSQCKWKGGQAGPRARGTRYSCHNVCVCARGTGGGNGSRPVHGVCCKGRHAYAGGECHDACLLHWHPWGSRVNECTCRFRFLCALSLFGPAAKVHIGPLLPHREIGRQSTHNVCCSCHS
jgi:hypothetical protein